MAAPPELATTKIRIAQPRIVVFSVAIYWLITCRLGHVRALYSVDLHMLHLRSTRCGRSAAASTAPSIASSWVVCAREAPSAPNRTPPLAIYVRFFALFLY